MTKAPLKLLIFIHDLAPFGAQRVALALAKGLPREKFSVAVCPFGGDLSLRGEFEAAGAAVLPAGARRYLDAAAWRRAAGIISSAGPCIVQTNLPELSVPARLLAAFLPGVKVLHTVQNPSSSEPLVWRLLDRLSAGLCAGRVYSSEGLRAAEGGLAAASEAIPNCVEPAAGSQEERGKARAAFGFNDGDKVVCCVGRLTAQKGQDLLIRALAGPALKGRGLRLLLVGDGEEEARLRALAAASGVNVVFAGRRRDPGLALAAADLYAAPSRWESFDIALGEAMLAGLPCAASAIPGHADLLAGGEAGLAVPPEDSAALALVMARLLDEQELAGRLGRAARARVEERFGIAAMVERYSALYRRLAGRAT